MIPVRGSYMGKYNPTGDMKSEDGSLRHLEKDTPCYCCGEATAVILCRGCGIPLCYTCVRLEDYGFGCDGGQILAFCPACVADPGINTVLDLEP
jgi:hypothetical protein